MGAQSALLDEFKAQAAEQRASHQELLAEIKALKEQLNEQASDGLSEEDSFLWTVVRGYEDEYSQLLHYAQEEYEARTEATGELPPQALSQHLERHFKGASGKGFSGFDAQRQNARRQLKLDLLRPTTAWGGLMQRRADLAREHAENLTETASMEDLERLPLASWTRQLLVQFGERDPGAQPTRPNYIKIMIENNMLTLPGQWVLGRKAGSVSIETPIPDDMAVHSPGWAAWWCHLGKYRDAWDKDDLGWYPLHHACDSVTFSQRAFFAACALADEVDWVTINAQTQAPMEHEKGFPVGFTPLHFACDGSSRGFRNLELVEKLLACNANMGVKDP